jgi:hypothetical protein
MLTKGALRAAIVAIALVLVSLPSVFGRAAEQRVILQPTAIAYVRSATPDTRLGGRDYVWAGYGCDDWSPDCMATTRGLVRFDLSGIPANSEIVDAQLRASITGFHGEATPNNSYHVASVREGWSESNVTWKNKPNVGVVYDSVMISSIRGQVTWQVTRLVQEWHDGPVNYGIYLKRDDEANGPDHDRKFSNLQLVITYEPLPSYDLLIVAPARFAAALQPLVDHKNATGIATTVLTLGDASRRYEGQDLPEKIKRAIAYYERHHFVRYVMLVGDSDIFPVRYTLKCEGEDSHYLHTYRSGDLYYADLYEEDGAWFEDWDGNRDGQYGEQGCDVQDANVDNLDMRPDVAVGRVPVSTEAELVTYVDKVLRYERQAAGATWTERAVFITGDYSGSKDYANDAVVPLTEDFRLIKLYHDAPGCDPRRLPTPDNINAQLNQGALFVTYIGHGSRVGWVTGGEGGSCAGVPAVYYNVETDISGLHNAGKLPVVFTFGCETGQYAPPPPWNFPYLDLDEVERDHSQYVGSERMEPERPTFSQKGYDVESMAEHLLVLAGEDGAIAFVGPVVYDVTAQSWKLAREVFRSYAYGHTILGDAWLNGFRAYVDLMAALPNVGMGLADAWLFKNVEVFHLFGDPSLRIGGI